jgi:hypothetical protein
VIPTDLQGEHLSAVWGSGTGDVWVVGYEGVILKWEGDVLSRLRAGSTPYYLTGVWGTGAGEVWAVGWYGTILRWSGKAWSAAPIH